MLRMIVVLKRTSPRFWLPTLTLLWGVVATLMGIVKSFEGFLVARFFLGVTESGLFPGVIFYLSMWYRRREQHYRVALFFSAAALAGAFGGVMAWVPLPPLVFLCSSLSFSNPAVCRGLPICAE